MAEDPSAKGVDRIIKKKINAEVKVESRTKAKVRGRRLEVIGYRLEVKELKFKLGGSWFMVDSTRLRIDV
jgi:hypothetical protein